MSVPFRSLRVEGNGALDVEREAMCDRLKIEAVVVKHLAAMRDELRGVVPMLDVVLEMELDRASDWLNFRYVCLLYTSDAADE